MFQSSWKVGLDLLFRSTTITKEKKPWNRRILFLDDFTSFCLKWSFDRSRKRPKNSSRKAGILAGLFLTFLLRGKICCNSVYFSAEICYCTTVNRAGLKSSKRSKNFHLNLSVLGQIPFGRGTQKKDRHHWPTQSQLFTLKSDRPMQRSNSFAGLLVIEASNESA